MQRNLNRVAALSTTILVVVGLIIYCEYPNVDDLVSCPDSVSQVTQSQTHFSNTTGIPINDESSTVRTPPLGVVEAENTDAFNVTRFSRHRTNATSDLLWLSLTYNKESWGRNRLRWTRTIDDYLKLLPPQHNVETISLGLLTSSPDEYHKYKAATSRYPFAKVDIILHPGYHSLNGSTVDREHRHDDDVQTARRSEIALLRNYLMLKTLGAEEHVLWVDADIFRLDQGIVERILQHIRDEEDVGLVTARCSRDGAEDYDRNAWRGTRKGPRGWDLDQNEIAKGELKTQGQYHVDKLIVGTTNDDLIDLDTIGATILYLRSSLIWQGLNFPHQFVIGTRWRKDGWDGIESEGLCYRARGLTGGKCAVLGGEWSIQHTDF